MHVTPWPTAACLIEALSFSDDSLVTLHVAFEIAALLLTVDARQHADYRGKRFPQLLRRVRPKQGENAIGNTQLFKHTMTAVTNSASKGQRHAVTLKERKTQKNRTPFKLSTPTPIIKLVTQASCVMSRKVFASQHHAQAFYNTNSDVINAPGNAFSLVAAPRGSTPLLPKQFHHPASIPTQHPNERMKKRIPGASIHTQLSLWIPRIRISILPIGISLRSV